MAALCSSLWIVSQSSSCQRVRAVCLLLSWSSSNSAQAFPACNMGHHARGKSPQKLPLNFEICDHLTAISASELCGTYRLFVLVAQLLSDAACKRVREGDLWSGFTQ